MNREEKRMMLQEVTNVGENLSNDVVVVEHKVIQTANDIERLEEILEDLKQKKDAVYADDYMAFNIVDSMGECIVPLSCVVAKLQHKIATLKMELEVVNEATTELGVFANKVPGIPTNE